MFISQISTLKNSSIADFIKVLLRGISQVILIENAISGFLILLAIMIYSYSLGLMALLSSFLGTVVGKLGGADTKDINQGLFGYNSVLTGISLSLFLEGSFRWFIALSGAFIAAIFTAIVMHITKKVRIPTLTFPFIIVTWLILLSSYKLKALKLSPLLVPQDLVHWKLYISGNINWVEGVFSGIGQVFFLDHILSGIILFIAVFWSSWKFGVLAIIGNALALMTAYLLGAEHPLIIKGLYGYNAILTILAVGIVFSSPQKKYNFLSGFIATILTVPITASISIWLIPYGLPALTMPFVLSSWIFIGARNILPNL
ncbi:urea transporter [Priestia aryabhattai]|uniref:urea transporter n=1 Tax=Priestia aryabhattai TaxID=412384 RepID=UPI0011777906|nr:urea transporter [Priestia aryabhattai]